MDSGLLSPESRALLGWPFSDGSDDDSAPLAFVPKFGLSVNDRTSEGSTPSEVFVLRGPPDPACSIVRDDWIQDAHVPRLSQEMAMGVAVAIVCLLLLLRERWILAETVKGQRLVKWCGATRASWLLRSLLLAGALFGGLLAGGVIRPLKW